MFVCSTDNISLHLKNIFNEEELEEKATTEDFSVVQKEGIRNVTRKLNCERNQIGQRTISGLVRCEWIARKQHPKLRLFPR